MRSFDRQLSAWTQGLSVRSGLWLLSLLPLHASCQPSVNASAEGPVQPTTPPVYTPPPATAETVPPVTSAEPATSQPGPVAPSPGGPTPPVDAVPTSQPTSAQPAPTSIPTTLPTAIPTTIPTTFPTTFPTALPPTNTTPPPAGTPPASGRVRTEGDRILLPGNIVFESGKTVLSLTPENQTVLTQLQQFLNENPKVTQIRIEGYTDNVGQPESNLKLSGERALAIKQWLVSQGVAADRVLAVGFGQEKPIADNGSAAGKAQNRRTEFKIAAVNGRPYRGVPILGGGTEFK